MSRTRKTKSAIWRRLALGALGIILGLSICLANAKGLASDQMPMPFGVGIAVVMSGSMSPALEVDDLVIVRERDSYDVGDVVVYQSGSKLIVHRIIAREGEQIITQGDANNVADTPIEEGMIKGAVAARLPSLGAAVKVLKSHVVVILLLVVAFVLIERSFRAEKRADEEDLEGIKAEIRRLKAELNSEGQEGSDRKGG